VRDSGIGIRPERLEGVFEMFSQEEAALSRSRGGLGIGLALTRKLVQLHGGTIVARSEGPGKGSEFVVRVPATQEAAPAPAEPLAQLAPADAGAGEGLRIVVADDNADAAETLSLLLELLGHQVRRAHDGEEAVDAVAAFDPQLVLLDVGMPRLNGYDACRRIRALPTRTPRTLVAVTGWGQARDLENSRAAGFDHHLVKPVDMAQLQGLLANAGVVEP
jgi:CheY-like chemotaxis protein